jgi:adenine-specific DNA-methyltransferase
MNCGGSQEGHRGGTFIPFVSTRYQGSKQRLIPFFDGVLGRLEFDSAVDVFGGTASVSHWLKRLGKHVHYNDALLSNQATGLALIENSSVVLQLADARKLFAPVAGVSYDDFIARTFAGVFYPDAENRWLDVVAQNLLALECRFTQALARHALFQACLMKRPFNLFHRKNLSVRTASVARTFGNKTTWERSFEELFDKALVEANAAVFDNGRANRATCLDAFACPLDADLVYLDPPYVRADGAAFRYLDGYHFLEGLIEYPRWGERIDRTRKHLPYARPRSAFEDARTAPDALFELFAAARRSRFIVLSYRKDGLPSVPELAQRLADLGRSVEIHERPGGYALSRRQTSEVLLVASARAARGA